MADIMLWFVWIGSLGGQDGDYVPDDETYYGHVAFVTEAAGQVYKQTTELVYLGATVCKNTDHTAEINRRVLLASLRFRRSSLPLYHQSTASLRLKVRMFEVRMFEAEVLETVLYGCVT